MAPRRRVPPRARCRAPSGAGLSGGRGRAGPPWAGPPARRARQQQLLAGDAIVVLVQPERVVGRAATGDEETLRLLPGGEVTAGPGLDGRRVAARAPTGGAVTGCAGRRALAAQRRAAGRAADRAASRPTRC